MGIKLRPVTAVVLLGVVLVVGSVGSVVLTESIDDEFDPAEETIELETDDRSLWLYTSRAPAFDSATLAINLVIYEEPEQVEQWLLEDGTGEWEELEDDEQDFVPQETDGEITENATIQWGHTTGDTRYVYLTGSESEWLAESFEVHDGTYLGDRYHIRVYEPPDGDAEWTALQAHDEYWDLFEARHVVTSVEDAQTYVEAEFLEDSDYEVVRQHVGGQDRVDFDGWLTVVNPGEDGQPAQSTLLVLGVLLLGVSAVRTGRDTVAETLEDVSMERYLRAFVLGGGLIAVYMSVRLALVAGEQVIDIIPPNVLWGISSPLLFFGLPITAYLLARRLDRTMAFIAASLGFLTALLLDYTYLGVTAVPLDILVHRGALIVALGLIAAGGSLTEREDPTLQSNVQIGVLLWLVATLLPLLKHTALPV